MFSSYSIFIFSIHFYLDLGNCKVKHLYVCYVANIYVLFGMKYSIFMRTPHYQPILKFLVALSFTGK